MVHLHDTHRELKAQDRIWCDLLQQRRPFLHAELWLRCLVYTSLPHHQWNEEIQECLQHQPHCSQICLCRVQRDMHTIIKFDTEIRLMFFCDNLDNSPRPMEIGVKRYSLGRRDTSLTYFTHIWTHT